MTKFRPTKFPPDHYLNSKGMSMESTRQAIEKEAFVICKCNHSEDEHSNGGGHECRISGCQCFGFEPVKFYKEAFERFLSGDEKGAFRIATAAENYWKEMMGYG